jgi:N-acetylneuraminic acid mutarotase
MHPQAFSTAITVGLLLSMVAHGEALWMPVTSLNIPRQETAAARIGGNVYVVGGLLENVPSVATKSVEVYDIAGNSWSLTEEMPIGLDHAAAAALDERLYVIGGFARTEQGQAVAQSAVYIYDPESNEWSTGVSLPNARAAACAVAHRGRIFVFGGVDPDHGVVPATFVFDPESNAWDDGAAMPTAREHLNAVGCGRSIYVIGGRNGGTSYNVNERYDPVTNEWETMAPMTNTRSAVFLAAWGSKIYCAGGEAPMLFDVNEVYDVITDTWGDALTMAVPRHGLPAVVIPSGILAPGGGVIQGLDPTNHTDLFVPEVSSGDLNNDTTAGAVDVQLAINGVLDFDIGAVNADIDADGEYTALDIQRAINEALNL